MASEIVVLFGDLQINCRALEALIAEFGWSLKEVRTVRDLAQANFDHNLVAVLFDPRPLPWDRALGVIAEAAPRALPILCHRFAEAIDWPQVAEAGAFHSLPLPLNTREARQILGFAWAATRRSVAISLPVHLDTMRASSRQTQDSLAHAATMVA